MASSYLVDCRPPPTPSSAAPPRHRHQAVAKGGEYSSAGAFAGGAAWQVATL